MTDLASLSEPLQLPAGLTLPNRLAKAAMSENLADERSGPTDALLRLYERFGASGAGLLISGNVIIAPGGRTEPHNIVVEDDRHLPQLRRWAEAAQSKGSRLFMQISHAGRQTPKTVTSDPVGPSDVPMVGMAGAFARPRALTSQEIEGLVLRYATTARVAKEAGFAGVQLHGAHGYLISQFLSPRTNLRDDEWGGDIEGRMRFILHIVERTRAAVGPEFPIAVKLNSADFQKGGFSLEDSTAVAKALEKAGIDLLEISGGSYEAPRMIGDEGTKRESTRRREAFFFEYAERMRAAVELPLMLTGGFRTGAAMADALASGAIDVVGLARPLALEPDLPARLLSGEAKSARAVEPKVGIRLLDSLLQLGWYQRQMARMGDGLDPDPGLSNWGTVLRVLGSNFATIFARMFRRPPRDALAAAGEAR
jgi:2,4-dienoyl-CoA reductase-like NADH-dependent reductase (Old Yellow Enzyme family)